MSILNGDSGLASVGTLKTFTTSLATPQETLLSTPLALPTSLPATAQVSYTLQASDFPTITPTPLDVKYCAVVMTCGKNTSASSETLTYQVGTNGTFTGNIGGSVVATNLFWNQSHYRWLDVAVGSLLEIKLFATSASVNLDYYALFIYPTRMKVTNCPVVQDIEYTFSSPTLVLGTPVSRISAQLAIYPSNATNIFHNPNTTPFRIGAMGPHPTYQLGRINYGDWATSTDSVYHATNRPWYNANQYPSKLTFREVR